MSAILVVLASCAGAILFTYLGRRLAHWMADMGPRLPPPTPRSFGPGSPYREVVVIEDNDEEEHPVERDPHRLDRLASIVADAELARVHAEEMRERSRRAHRTSMKWMTISVVIQVANAVYLVGHALHAW